MPKKSLGHVDLGPRLLKKGIENSGLLIQEENGFPELRSLLLKEGLRLCLFGETISQKVRLFRALTWSSSGPQPNPPKKYLGETSDIIKSCCLEKQVLEKGGSSYLHFDPEEAIYRSALPLSAKIREIYSEEKGTPRRQGKDEICPILHWPLRVPIKFEPGPGTLSYPFRLLEGAFRIPLGDGNLTAQLQFEIKFGNHHIPPEHVPFQRNHFHQCHLGISESIRIGGRRNPILHPVQNSGWDFLIFPETENATIKNPAPFLMIRADQNIKFLTGKTQKGEQRFWRIS